MARANMKPFNIPVITLLVAGAVAGWLWHEQTAIYDWTRLYNYSAPPEVAQLADETTMTPYARHLFYVYHPQIEGSTQFNRDCNVTPQVIVLGCTVSYQGIYLYQVQDPQLNGLEQTTAAYEMLHVGYARLNASARAKVDAMVMSAYTTASVTDPQLVQEEQSYLKTEGQGAVANELHSMMGTEVANLPPALAEYYSQYFTNRQAVLGYKNQYESVFLTRQATVARDDAELAGWKTQIAANEQAISADNARLNEQYSQLKGLEDQNDIDGYNAGVPAYNASVASETSLVTSTQQLIADYNQVVSSRNEVALEVDKLDQTISSQPLSGVPPLKQ